MARPRFRPPLRAVQQIKLIKRYAPLTADDELIEGILENHTLTPEAVAVALGCSIRTLQRLRLPRIEYMGQVRYKPEQVIDWIQRQHPVAA